MVLPHSSTLIPQISFNNKINQIILHQRAFTLLTRNKLVVLCESRVKKQRFISRYTFPPIL